MKHEKVINSAYNPKICVIGAGPSGVTAIKNLQEHGLTNMVVFEKNNHIGGNWVYDEVEGHSSIYETTHLISSKRWSQFDDFPMPDSYPDYPSHKQVLDYFNHYARHFDLEKYITFNTTVLKVEQTALNKWTVYFQNSEGCKEEEFDYLLVANGHHWDPVHPSYSGAFNGDLLHSHQYKKAAPYKGQRVLVVGGGNSACDIAVETSRVTQKTAISMRRGYHIFPKFIFGKPTDTAVKKIHWIPPRLRQKIIKVVIRALQGRYAKYHLMTPDEGPLECHPVINSELLYGIRHGTIQTYPEIERFEGNKAFFVNGTSSEFDAVIFATGYKISFPFFSDPRLNFSETLKIPLYRKMIHPDFPTLYFIGLFQPQGCIWPLADYQAKIAAQMIKGLIKRPEKLNQKIMQEINKPHYRFKSNRRHALEVDYHLFKRELISMLHS